MKKKMMMKGLEEDLGDEDLMKFWKICCCCCSFM